MIKAFEKWVTSHRRELEHKGIAVDFARRDSPSPAAVVTLESKSLVGSITVWDSGACDLHMLSYETGEPVIGDRYDFQSIAEIEPVWEGVLRRMVGNN